MTHKTFEEILHCSGCSSALTDKDWDEKYSVPLSMTIKEIRSLSKTLLTYEKQLDNKRQKIEMSDELIKVIADNIIDTLNNNDTVEHEATDTNLRKKIDLFLYGEFKKYAKFNMAIEIWITTHPQENK